MEAFLQLTEKTKNLLRRENGNEFSLVAYHARFLEDSNIRDTSPYLITAYSNNEYWIDSYGNFYVDKMHYFQALRKFYGFKSIKEVDGQEWIIIPDANEAEFLNRISECFERIHSGRVYTWFMEDFRNFSYHAVMSLVHIKYFLHFFLILEEMLFTYETLEWIRFLVGAGKIRLLFSITFFYDVSLTQEFNFALFKQDLQLKNFKLISDIVQYELCLAVMGLLIPCQRESDSQNIEICKRFPKRSYRELCFIIAIDLVKHLRDTSGNKIVSQLCPNQVKNILFWINAKYGNEENTLQEYSETENDVKNSYKLLIEDVDNDDNRLSVHKFRFCFSAAYHFQEHYMPIYHLIPPKLNFPVLDDNNVTECVRYYLKVLPGEIFVGNFLREVDGGAENRRQNYCFIHRANIKGIKYKFLKNGERGKNNKGNTHNLLHRWWSTGTWISTMHEIKPIDPEQSPDSLPFNSVPIIEILLEYIHVHFRRL